MRLDRDEGRLLPAPPIRLGLAAAPRWPWRPVLGFVAEAKPSGQYATFHAGIAGSILDMLANTVELMRTTPTTGHVITSGTGIWQGASTPCTWNYDAG